MISFFRWLGKFLKHMTAEPTGALLKPGDPGYQEVHTLSSNLDKNIKIITEIFGLCDDLMVRGLKIGRGKKQVRVAVIYLDPLINHTRLQQGLMHCLQTIDHLPSMGVTTEWLINNALSDGRVIEKKSFVEITDEINRGAACLLIEGLDQALLIRLAEKIGRAVEGPVTENVSKGALDAFNEDVRTNIALLR